MNWQEVVEVLIKMVLALVCGGVLGIERGRKKRPAGFRTYMLVCLGAALVMMTNEYICEVYGSGDPARLGAQVISGIGFLGAGTIITTGHNRVKGLTTAAGLWAAACIGLAIGTGYYEGAVIGTLMIVVIMVVLHRLDRRIGRTTKMLILYIEFQKMSVVKRVGLFAKEHNIVVETKKFNGLFTKFMYNNEAVILLKPLSYMNLSGEVVRSFVDYFKIDIKDILIINDDLDMSIGKIKLKEKGSSGGHNGLKNIELHLKTSEYKRLKIGISNNKMIDTKDYVLGKLNEEETNKITEILPITNKIIEDFTTVDFNKIMSKYNDKKGSL